MRATLYYSAIVFLMAVTAVFNGMLDWVLVIIFSLLSSICLSIFLGVLCKLLKAKNRIFNFIGIILVLGIIGFAWYAILVVAAGKGVYDANMWAIQ